jgi:2-C-methyl-D-erythritol 4-phosphate cytidylyltransferase/2-C-methyl-D-erythritol 2,4-cyclodiphosphate synthase
MAGCVALIVAAGRGTRLGNALGTEDTPPKQYLPLAGRPMLALTVETFTNEASIDQVQVVIHGDDLPFYDAAMEGFVLPAPVNGGETRQDSVRLGLESLAGQGFQNVLIHDAARPLVDSAVIQRTLAALDVHDGAIPAIAVTDSLKRAQDGQTIGEDVDRTGLWRVQTPQGFGFEAILEAHREAARQGLGELTDDAAVASHGGLSLSMVQGDEDNLKITDLADFERAERILAAGFEYRTGQGYDVHAFTNDRSGPVRLCGIDIPHDRGLTGHSDADAALHAITDAVLGAMADGDIGSHFPPSDAAWRDADSEIFLRHAMEITSGRNATIIHVDVTIICEAPKIAPHRDAMRGRLSDILGLTLDRISIKATTTEGLGALGRGEGIAAQALVTVALKRH